MDEIRVILANGNPTTLISLERILTGAEEIEVVAIAVQGIEPEPPLCSQPHAWRN